MDTVFKNILDFNKKVLIDSILRNYNYLTIDAYGFLYGHKEEKPAVDELHNVWVSSSREALFPKCLATQAGGSFSRSWKGLIIKASRLMSKDNEEAIVRNHKFLQEREPERQQGIKMDKRQEVKLAWARGEAVQFRLAKEEAWRDWDSKNKLSMSPFEEWRIKPEFIILGGIEMPIPQKLTGSMSDADFNLGNIYVVHHNETSKEDILRVRRVIAEKIGYVMSNREDADLLWAGIKGAIQQAIKDAE